MSKNSNERRVASTSDRPKDDLQGPSYGSRPPGTLPFTRLRGKGGSLELIFSTKPLKDEDAPVLLFHHIRKTAGTSLRHSLRASLGGLPVYVATPNDVGQEEYLSQLATWHIAYYDGLTSHERRRLIYAGGHTAGFLIPAMERPVQAFTMVREPVDQVLSRYFFVKERDWPLADICSDWTLRQRLVNVQAQSLLEPHFDVVEIPEDPDDPEAETWKARLFEVIAEYYTLGVQDRFDASLAMFQRKFGFGYRQMRNLRVNEGRPRDAQVDPETLDVLRRSSWLDRALYEHAAAELDRYFADKPDEAQDPRRAPVVRREERPSKPDPDADAAGSAPGVVERLERISRQLATGLGAIRDELGLIREDVREANLRVRALERKQRGRDEKRKPAERSAGSIAKGEPSPDKSGRVSPPSGKPAAAAKR